MDAQRPFTKRVYWLKFYFIFIYTFFFSKIIPRLAQNTELKKLK